MFSLFKKLRIRRTFDQTVDDKSGPDKPQSNLSADLKQNIQLLQSKLGQSNDIIIREIKVGSDKKINAVIIYVDGLVDRDLVHSDILSPLMFKLPTRDNNFHNHSDLLTFIQSSLLTVGQISVVNNIDMVIEGVLSGHGAILIEGAAQALDIDMRGWETRAVEEPQGELSLRGPKDAFTETLRTNTALLRRKIRDPNLTFENLRIGQRSKTDVVIAYIKGITPDSLIAEVRQRLERINIDAVLDAGYIEQFIGDHPASLFPTVGNTERPDVVTARILEGRAAILVDGSPMALTVPFLFMEAFQKPDDYYALPFYATFVRWIRLFGFILSVFLPGLYVSLTNFHPELFPTALLVSVAAAREGLPFPVTMETLLMLILFEILREAGLRMPRSLGQAVSIVGALVIGQASVAAGLVGAPMVVVVATTAIASFLVVALADLGALFRLIMTIVAGFLGLFGIVLVSVEVISHLLSLRSFGIPYLSPFAPLNIRDLKDSLVRMPLWAMDSRPESLGPIDNRRQSPSQMPKTSQPRAQKEKRS